VNRNSCSVRYANNMKPLVPLTFQTLIAGPPIIIFYLSDSFFRPSGRFTGQLIILLFGCVFIINRSCLMGTGCVHLHIQDMYSISTVTTMQITTSVSYGVRNLVKN